MRLSWRIFVVFFACTVLALAATTWYANLSLRRFHHEQVGAELLTKANVLSGAIATYFANSEWDRIDRHCKEFGRMTETRVTVILRDGTVIGDSHDDPSHMENHGSRPEIVDALGGSIGRSIRFSDTIRRTLMYLAVPMPRDGAVVGAVRASVPLAEIEWTLRSAYRQLVLGVLVVAAFSAAVALYLARRMSRPLNDMRAVAERLAQGDLQARVAMPEGPEMASLARTLNQMAAQLGERMDTITRQSDQQRAVFSSMVEGVLAVDGAGRILDLNMSAARLLDLVPDQARGLGIHEAVRNLEMQAFVESALSSGGPVEAEIVLYGNEERFLQLHGTSLTGPSGERLGALVVINDVTRVKRLETVRQDFVANVSHELKTPITAIKGCVETLSSTTRRSPEDNERFTAMMGRQVDRLNAIVDDLLSLSRLEHDAQRKCIPLEPGAVRDVLRRAAQAFARQADAKGIAVTTVCPDDLRAPINTALLEQAVGNLIDNAIKYSGERTRVTVSGTLRGNGIDIQVTDEGPGIEKKHLSRIFERFYRVDQARSRALGGTGLGLAIVKHIVLAHGGTVSADSTPGHGSVFTIRVPLQ